MQVSILGQLEVVLDGTPIDIAGARLRVLIGRLALDAGRSVSAAALIGDIWPDDPPVDARNALQSLVSRARRALGDPAAISQGPAGYLLQVSPHEVDAHRFLSLALQGRRELQSGDAAGAADTLRRALALWRGPLLGGADGAPAAGARWEELRLSALEDRIEADLAVSRSAATSPEPQLAAELHEAVIAHPLRERFSVLLLDVLHALGRVPEALDAFEAIRMRLADELGADPPAALRAAHARLLTDPVDGDGAPPPAVAWNGRHGLPAGRSSYVGRGSDALQVRRLMQRGRLVTLVGPGGAGKTRLATELAASLDDAADGVWLVELAGVSAEALDLPQLLLSGFGVRDTRLLDRLGQTPIERSAMERLEDALADRSAMIVLDNCEHVIDAAAALVDRLLATCRGVRVLATSREPLSITGEAVYAVAPLALPDGAVPLSELLDWPAVQLFVDRAQSAQPGFVLEPATAPATMEICRRLDGLPLALELAAARMRSLTVGQVADRLEDRFALLSAGSRTALPRHRTLHAVVAWSWDLLEDDERDLMERLSVFAGGISTDAAAQVCAAPNLLARLSDLADKSLLTPVESDEPRFRMLETIREFGVQRLAERQSELQARDAHARVFEELALQAAPHLRTSDQLRWSRRLVEERDNLFAALNRLSSRGEAERAVAMAMALSWFWTLIGAHATAASWLRVSLDIPGWVPSQERAAAQVLYSLNSSALGWLGGPSDQMTEARTVLASADPLGQDPLTLLTRIIASVFMDFEPALRGRADVAPIEDAQALIDTGLRSADPWVRAACSMIRGTVAENVGDLDIARRSLDEALERFESIGERWGLGNTLVSLARVRAALDDLDGAREAFSRSSAILLELGAEDDAAMSCCWTAELLLRTGDLTAAREQMAQARRLFERAGSTRGPMMIAVVDTSIARYAGDLPAALALSDDAVRQTEAGGRQSPPQIRSIALAQQAALIIELPEPDMSRASRQIAQALRIADEVNDMPVLAIAAVTSAVVLAARGEPREGARVLGLAQSVRGAAEATSLESQAAVRVLTALLGADDVAAARASGLAPRIEAVAELRELADRLDPVPRDGSGLAAIRADGQREEHSEDPETPKHAD